MQKLIFRNSLKEIDLTSGNFCVTNWEGLSGVDLDIQTQTVPFVDGSVYLDSLLENRDLNFTVAIYDGNDLALRYELKRKLISALNPKLGEGELFYTNDFISVKIKAVPHVPIFENKNSNDSGTLKVSVTFTACNPYWEDIATKEYLINNGETANIENDGDAEVNLKAIFLTGNVTNPSIKNLTTGKEIKMNGTFSDSVIIDTNFGNKGLSQDVFSLVADNLTVPCTIDIYSVKNKLIGVYVENNRTILFEISDLNISSPIFIADDYCYITVTNDVLYVIGRNIYNVYYTEDGVNFSRCLSDTWWGPNSICFFNGKYFFAKSSLYRSDDKSLSDNEFVFQLIIEGIRYIIYKVFTDGLKLYVEYGDSQGTYCLGVMSDDFSSCTELFRTTNGYLLCASGDEKLYFTEYGGGVNHPVRYISNGILSSDSYNIPSSHYINKIYFDEIKKTVLCCVYSEDKTYILENGEFKVFNPVVWSGYFYSCTYKNNSMYYITNQSENGNVLYTTNDGIQFYPLKIKGYYSEQFNSIAKNENLYMGSDMVSGHSVMISIDGLNWEPISENGSYVASFKNYLVIANIENNGIYYTHDGVDFQFFFWDPDFHFELSNILVYNQIFSTPDMLVILGKHGKIAVMRDFISFEVWQTPILNNISGGMYHNGIFILYDETCNLCYGTNNSWTYISSFFGEGNNKINCITYFNDKVIVLGSTDSGYKVKYTSDFINWFDGENKAEIVINNIWEHNNTIFGVEYGSGTIVKSADGVTWEKFSQSLKGGVGFTANDGRMIIPGAIATLHMEKTGEINVINHLTENSDMSFNFVEGNNIIMFSYDSGYATAKIEFNKRYIGV